MGPKSKHKYTSHEDRETAKALYGLSFGNETKKASEPYEDTVDVSSMDVCRVGEGSAERKRWAPPQT